MSQGFREILLSTVEIQRNGLCIFKKLFHPWLLTFVPNFLCCLNTVLLIHYVRSIIPSWFLNKLFTKRIN